MYEATTSQVYNLCTLGTAASVSSGQGDYIDALVRARIFWYGYVLDGVTSALRGGRMLLYDRLSNFLVIQARADRLCIDPTMTSQPSSSLCRPEATNHMARPSTS